MLWLVRLILIWFWPRRRGPTGIEDLLIENLALRQQIAVLTRSCKKPRLCRAERAFWVLLSRRWQAWKGMCLLVRPVTVVRWHRAGFRLFWGWKSRRLGGRPRVDSRLRAIIRSMARENPLWGAPRIHGELLKLGMVVSERTVSRWMPRRPPDEKRAQTWRTFLESHKEVLAAMDILVVPTWNFRQLYVLVILDHGRRMIRHLNVTTNPTAAWVKQQLREAFPFDEVPRYLLFDRDTTFGAVKDFVRAMGIVPKQTSPRSPWQNGKCERVIGTLRRDLLDHVVVFNEDHLRRLLKGYLRYYHEDRTHLSLGKDCPRGRLPDLNPGGRAQIMAESRCGGLHHRYRWNRAA